MDFGEILERWEKRNGLPQNKKVLKHNSALNKKNPMDVWLKKHEVSDKDTDNINCNLNPAEERKRLKEMKPQAKIDLHGMTIEQAETALNAFFSSALNDRIEKVLIIHGKGNHSQNGGVLKDFVKAFLERHSNAGERGSCKNIDGGSGSTWVILKN